LGKELAGAAAVLLLTLPGWSCIYQGDEIGMIHGNGGENVLDRTGRDALRHPMQWTPDGVFTTGVQWLPVMDPQHYNVSSQKGVTGSTLEKYCSLIYLRRELSSYRVQ
jgi:alpha-glucosidase